MHYHFADLLKQFDAFDPPQNRIGTSRIKKIPSEMDVTLLLLLTLFTLFILFNTVHTIQTALHRLNSSIYAYCLYIVRKGRNAIGLMHL